MVKNDEMDMDDQSSSFLACAKIGRRTKASWCDKLLVIVHQPLFVVSQRSETPFEPSKFTPFDGIGSRLGQLGIFERLRTRGRLHGGSFCVEASA
jgi:hypothetical protein